MSGRKTVTVLEIQNLMLETLAYKADDVDSEGKTFFKHGYQGTESDLFSLMEALAIKNSLIDNKIQLGGRAWGSDRDILHANYNTNFSREEIKKIYEAFHTLLNRGIISPGAIGNYGSNLPNFHVTEYGLKCLEETDILPYDNEGYLDKLNKINNLDDWVKFYIEQALECFNSYCYEASLIMVGLASEFITQRLINNYLNYLNHYSPSEGSRLKNQLDRYPAISTRYLKYLDSLKTTMNTDVNLKKLSKYLDQLANVTFMSYMRLTRNELSHPSEIKTDRITTLMIFVSFIKYCEGQYIFINYFENNYL